MNVTTAIRLGYASALVSTIMHEGQPVPVYDAYSIPEGVKYPYIIISTQTEVERRVKWCRMYEATVLVDIVTGSLAPSGRRDSEDIAAQIEGIINPITGPQVDITAHGFKIGDTEREMNFDSQDRNDVYYVYRKLVRYRHLVEKIL